MARRPGLRREGLLALAVLAALVAAGCRSLSPSEELHELYLASEEDPGIPEDLAAHARIERERAERVARVHELLALPGHEEESGRLYAAAVLLDSKVPEDLDLARDLALAEAEAGDDRGLRLAAEAMDRGAYLRGEPQPYGTQFVFDPVTDRWGLYEVDARTTDVERKAMGVPPLAASLARARRMNGDR